MRRVLTIFVLSLLMATMAVAQSHSVTVSTSDGGSLSAFSTTVGNSTYVTISRSTGGDPRLHPVAYRDPVYGEVEIMPPIISGPLDSNLNSWPVRYDFDRPFQFPENDFRSQIPGFGKGMVFHDTPPYPLALYRKIWPFMFPKEPKAKR